MRESHQTHQFVKPIFSEYTKYKFRWNIFYSLKALYFCELWENRSFLTWIVIRRNVKKTQHTVRTFVKKQTKLFYQKLWIQVGFLVVRVRQVRKLFQWMHQKFSVVLVQWLINWCPRYFEWWQSKLWAVWSSKEDLQFCLFGKRLIYITPGWNSKQFTIPNYV